MCIRCTLVDWALHACGLGAARLWIGLPIKGLLIMAFSYNRVEYSERSEPSERSELPHESTHKTC